MDQLENRIELSNKYMECALKNQNLYTPILSPTQKQILQNQVVIMETLKKLLEKPA